MTQINLPNKSVTGTNLWSQVEDNDQTIVDVVNGDLDATNLANDAVTADKLADSVSTDANRAVTTNHIRNGAVTGAKIANATIPASKLSGIRTYSTIGESVGTNGSDVLWVDVENVAPGTYIATGHLGTTSANRGRRLRITVEAGTATVTGPQIGDQSFEASGFSNSAIVVVTSTAKIGFRGNAVSGFFIGTLTLFGLG